MTLPGALARAAGLAGCACAAGLTTGRHMTGNPMAERNPEEISEAVHQVALY